jgi:L-Ala-D/L-Glu epimerase
MAQDKLILRLSEAFLVYPAGQEIHTAASGRILDLHELFLEIEDKSNKICAIGEIRANIGFITGTPNAAVRPAVLSLLGRLAGARDANDLEARFAEVRSSAPKIAQALVENALVDLEAKLNGVPACVALGGSYRPALECNQCIFWGSDEDMVKNLAIYRAGGFSRIKLRVGVGTLNDDLRRLAWLRSVHGHELVLSIDANGAWSAEEALFAINRLRPFNIEYIEQPTHPGDWDALEKVAAEAGIPVLIDEGLQTDDDVARVCANGGRIGAHLKIAKAGGARRLVAIGRRFDAHRVGYVAGQMNEGAAATAISVHAGLALAPKLGELYGALGIINDPCEGVTYEAGKVSVRNGPGIGVTLRRDRMTAVWESGSLT